MSGVAVVNAMLTADADLIAAMPVAQIFSGPVEQGTPLPAIAIMQISGVPFNTVAMAEPNRLYTDRVQVTAFAKSYDEVKTLLELVRLALPMATGTVNGVDLDSIRPDIVGPDLFDQPASIHEQSRDFIVKWRAPNTAPMQIEDGAFILLE